MADCPFDDAALFLGLVGEEPRVRSIRPTIGRRLRNVKATFDDYYYVVSSGRGQEVSHSSLLSIGRVNGGYRFRTLTSGPRTRRVWMGQPGGA